MHDFKSDTAKIIHTIVEGIGIIILVVIVLGSVFGLTFHKVHENNQKVQNMTSLCIEKGYDGWEDDLPATADDDDRPRGCFKNAE